MSNDKKLADSIAKHLNDVSVSEQLVMYHLNVQTDFVLNRFFNLVMNFIYAQARKYEDGLIPEGQYTNVVMCKRIKDEVLEPWMEGVREYEEPSPIFISP